MYGQLTLGTVFSSSVTCKVYLLALGLCGMCWCKKELTGMLNGNGKLSSASTTNVCRRDGDVLLIKDTIEDELHIRVPLLPETKVTSILPRHIC